MKLPIRYLRIILFGVHQLVSAGNEDLRCLEIYLQNLLLEAENANVENFLIVFDPVVPSLHGDGHGNFIAIGDGDITRFEA